MPLLEYNLTHPYPRSRLFTTITLVLIVLVTPVLILVNIVTGGYELVPSLRQDFQRNDTIPSWWASPRLPPLLRRKAPLCEPKDIGRGDMFRLSPSLFEYKVLSSWRTNAEQRSSEDEGRVEYRGGSFEKCEVYNIRFDFNLLEFTQTLTAAVACPEFPVRAYMETQIVFANELSKDHVGQYYGYAVDLFNFINVTSSDYRKAVFAVLDVISTDSLSILGGQYLGFPVLSLSALATISSDSPEVFFDTTAITYLNGTVNTYNKNNLGESDIYRASISNVMRAVHHAVLLDLGNAGPGNIFINRAAVNDTFEPNLAPIPLNASAWVDENSFYYGRLIPPYRTWAEMLRAGLPGNITLGGLTGLPSNSTMITNYLCPSYQRKPMDSFLASTFIGTATMLLSAWGAWTFVSATAARQIRGPCIKCKCGSLLDGEQGNNQCEHAVVQSGLATGLVPLPPDVHARLSSNSVLTTEKGESGPETLIQEVPKASPVT